VRKASDPDAGLRSFREVLMICTRLPSAAARLVRRRAAAMRRVAFSTACVVATVASDDVVRPADAATAYVLSGTPDGSGGILVDDGMDVYRNGALLYTDGGAGSGVRNPIAFNGDVGDTLRFVLHDTFGTCATLVRVFLTDPQGRSTIAVPGYEGGCSNPPVDRGVVFETTFVIPDLAATGPSYVETLLPGSAFAGVVRGPGGALYGATYDGGMNGKGAIYAASSDLSQVTTVHDFVAATDGSVPYGDLTLSGSVFYGTTERDGPSGGGTIFKFDPSNGSLTTVVPFALGGLSGPRGPLLVIGDVLYGSTSFAGGSALFRVRTDGTSFDVLHAFSGPEGLAPGALTLGPGGFLYGAAEFGGDPTCYPAPYNGCGTIFRIRPDAAPGSDVEVLHTFTVRNEGFPQRKLVVGSDGRLYGTTYRTVFTLLPDGSDYHVLYPISAGSQIFSPPIETLDGRLRVAQYDGGAHSAGLVFSLDKSGGTVMPEHEFSFATDTAFGPYGILFQDTPGVVFGTTEYSSTTSSHGMVFAIRSASSSSASAVIGPAGGSVATPDGSVEVVILPGALSQPTTITIDAGLAGSAYGVGTASTRALVANIGPPGTMFAIPAQVHFRWRDSSPNDGLVDGILTPEGQLRVYKNGVAITNQCDWTPAPAACPTCCDQAANDWEVAIMSFSEFVLVDEPCIGFTGPKLTLGKVAPPGGDDTLAFKGAVSLPPAALALDPIAEGLRVALTGDSGTVFDVAIPPGAFAKATKTGWKVDKKHTRWTFTAPRGTGPAGLGKATLVLKEGILKVTLGGALGDYAAGTPLGLRILLPGSGTCADTAFDDAGQACEVKNKGKTVICK